MKVYLHFKESGDPFTIKLTLPKSWRKGEFMQLQKVFIENYNSKHESKEKLNEADYHLENKEGTVFAKDGIVEDFCSNSDDIFLVKGAPQTLLDLGLISAEEQQEKEESKRPKKKALPLTESEKASLRAKQTENKITSQSTLDMGEEVLLQCKNFGCQKKFKESQNSEKACQHHTKPPIFHETRKYWACCPDKIAWDWDTFTSIPGCQVARHTTKSESGKRFLGGTDVRAAREENVPQQLNKKETALDKLSALRKALTKVGLSGSVFDDARDRIKNNVVEENEDVKKIWDTTLERLVATISQAFEAQK